MRSIPAATASLCYLLLVACSDERPQPPQQTGSGSASGSGSAGGGSGAGTAGEVNLCECAASLGVKPESASSCAACLKQVVAPLQPCHGAVEACLADPGCVAVRDCLEDCQYKPACHDACMLPFDESASKLLFREVLACACEPCQAACTYPQQLTCIDPGGQGGQGGAGGLGGQGGLGGEAAAGGAGGLGGEAAGGSR